ncbi:hypothetical protein SBF1_5370002 [Candidatus Desulfosporosinus infrequens]|uniref:Uncharacterized protein n=1 Tax=Candidatus Desulfosporosinus infrequens TaxID=2043169 RepID=A0A2U3LJ42_9FIRM|nr:hypothetical protein SBF1_5370002 [Candidatus Desulfosporosinus infrequens]
MPLQTPWIPLMEPSKLILSESKIKKGDKILSPKKVIKSYPLRRCSP